MSQPTDRQEATFASQLHNFAEQTTPLDPHSVLRASRHRQSRRRASGAVGVVLLAGLGWFTLDQFTPLRPAPERAVNVAQSPAPTNATGSTARFSLGETEAWSDGTFKTWIRDASVPSNLSSAPPNLWVVRSPDVTRLPSNVTVSADPPRERLRIDGIDVWIDSTPGDEGVRQADWVKNGQRYTLLASRQDVAGQVVGVTAEDMPDLIDFLMRTAH